MTASSTMPDPQEHFAHCIQVLGGTTAASRRLGIDERALRRFINGERPISAGLMHDTAKALSLMIAQASEAEARITAAFGPAPDAS
ncbi:hypothetical protein [Novosphingobium sediminicola]|uniref:DNA-binding transcriptional regulator YdaS (Cro superfamily) n=1 Tax=Novosphingobium sediminicola TaxID=563162 RepID=A0A7W6CBI3_9SPHN|nr:hypothetical protein [Novosphingobium sediminicola]MBB3953519.1 DNA-binding transcriptional regulator YdaS (Cro superfamily) [Novosphingobium sediminicola]